MKFDPLLTKAIRLSRRRKYGEAVKTLESEVFRYHDSFWYYYVLGASCLRGGDFGGAFTYFKRARDIKMRSPLGLLGLAVLYFRRGETDRALDLYLEVLEVDEHNRIARKALNTIRKYAGTDTLPLLIESGRLSRFYPPLPKTPLPPWKAALSAILLGLILVGGGLLKFGLLPLPGRTGAPREGLAGSALDREEREAPVQVGGTFRYILTRDQVLDTYHKARSLFTGFRDEAARVELNRLLESNASEPVKNKARLLLPYLEVPGFGTLRDRFSYGEVIRDPALYRGCHVIWRGMAANLDAQENTTAFDLLVGYDTHNSLEGIVPVVFHASVTVDLERPLEVLGRVIPAVPGDGQGQAAALEGLALYQQASSK
ncbi:MAG: tetratricopeptide repeat protein [Spirochaetaceae bacterium]|jgi:hypothetical protein|nr:tetratricopeptide repeat protein [Spirochaetaceae bacterium]